MVEAGGAVQGPSVTPVTTSRPATPVNPGLSPPFLCSPGEQRVLTPPITTRPVPGVVVVQRVLRSRTRVGESDEDGVTDVLLRVRSLLQEPDGLQVGLRTSLPT